MSNPTHQSEGHPLSPDVNYYVDLIEEKRREDYGDLSHPARGQIWLVKRTVTYPGGREEVLKPEMARPAMVLLMGFDEDFQDNPYSVAQVFPISKRWIFAC